MATKKKATKKTKRPPRQVWIVWSEIVGSCAAAALTRREAQALLETDDERVVGPFALVERVRER